MQCYWHCGTQKKPQNGASKSNSKTARKRRSSEEIDQKLTDNKNVQWCRSKYYMTIQSDVVGIRAQIPSFGLGSFHNQGILHLDASNMALKFPQSKAFLIFLAKRLQGVSDLCDSFLHVRSFNTKSAPRISRERFDLKSPTFYGYLHRQIPQQHRIWRQYLLYFRSEVIANKTWKYRFQRLLVEFLKKDLSADHQN